MDRVVVGASGTNINEIETVPPDNAGGDFREPAGVKSGRAVHQPNISCATEHRAVSARD